MLIPSGRFEETFPDWEGPVGTFDWPIQLESMDGERSLKLEALVDTGSFFTIVPASDLRDLGIVPTGEAELELADGHLVAYDVGEARATVEGRSVVTWVVFGAEGTKPLLGAYTMEGLFLIVDPYSRKLIPMPHTWA